MNAVKNIKTIREEKGYSQEVLANALEVDNAVISNIERGKRKLKIDELEIIANTLDVDLIYLLTYPDVYVKKESKNIVSEPFTEYGLTDKDKLILSLNERIKFQEEMIKELISKIK